MTKKMNNKPSAKRKLLPAIGMLTVSAMMLSSSTYAWFTMSKEVSLTGIQMTASVPADLQISLGNNMGAAAYAPLAGTITASTAESGKLRLTAMTAPGNKDADVDWSNTVALSDYYTFGKLTPATSINGENIFFTADSTIVGKTLKTEKVNNVDTITASFTQANKSGTNYTAAAAFNASKGTAATFTDPYANSGAYFIDIPVWFRTSSETETALGVKVTITPRENTAGNRTGEGSREDLYKAVRVAVLPSVGTVATTANTTDSLTGVEDVVGKGSSTTELKSGVLYDTAVDATLGAAAGYYRTAAGANITDSTKRISDAYTINAETSGTTNTWAKVTYVTQGTAVGSAGDTVVVVPAAVHTKQNYGGAARYTIRVWIEGEDVNCWNATAGQDFNIDLRFFNASATADPNA